MFAFRLLHGMRDFTGAALVAILTVGCGGHELSQSDSSEKGVLDRDVAETVASDLARESGGLIDQIGDLLEMASGATFDEPMRTQGAGYLWAAIRSAEYDEVKGDWTLAIERERGAPADDVYAFAERVYKVTFESPDGTSQKYFDTDGALASSIHLSISSGSGEHRCPNRVHSLTEVTGSFVATGVATPQITVNGTYHRRGVSTLIVADTVLTVSRWLDLTVNDVAGRRGADPDAAQTVTGTLTGEFRADVESASGGAPRLVDRSLGVTLGGGGAVITSGAVSYTGDLQAGEIQTDSLP